MGRGVHGAAHAATTFVLFLVFSVALAGCSGGGGKRQPTPVSNPTISTISPMEARVGDSIRISGTAFGTVPGQATLNGTPITSIQSWSDTEIEATVPEGASSGPITVTVGSATSNAVNFVVLPPPAVSSIDPTQGEVGTTVRITGTGFGATQDGSSVSFNDVPVTAVQAWSDTEIEATVPADAISGPVAVIVGSALSNSVDFTVLPVISAVSPAEAKAGETVLVTGSGFGSTQGGSTITINGIAVSAIESWSSTEIEATVPDGAASGDVIVTVGSTDSNAIRLVVPWTPGNPDNVRASSADHSMQRRVQMVSDGSGGAIMVWENIRFGSSKGRIYAQRVDRKGECQWGFGCGPGGTNPEGFPVTTLADKDANGQTGPRLIADGNGGAIVIWQDRRNSATTGIDIYAQHINADGQPQWLNDMVVSAALGDQSYPGSGSGVFSQPVPPELVSDGNGGAIVVWQDERNSGTTGADIYAQRINADGERQWENGASTGDFDGIPVSTAANRQHVSKLVSDGNGGAILVWEHLALDPSNGDNYVYMQRLSAAGVTQWPTPGAVNDGIELIRYQLMADAHPYVEGSPQLIADGSGGAIIVWRDRRDTIGSDIYAQRVAATGAPVWENGTGSGDYDGIPVSVIGGNQTYPKIVDDGNNGAIVVWLDNRDPVIAQLFAQRLNTDGERQWENGTGDFDGVPVTAYSTTANSSGEYNARMVADGSGGAIIAWEERRDSVLTGVDIYAQKLNASGVRQWENGVAHNTHIPNYDSNTYVANFDGIPISNDTDAGGVVVRSSNPIYNQFAPELVADGDGGAMIGWRDARDGGFAVYVQGITASGRQ